MTPRAPDPAGGADAPRRGPPWVRHVPNTLSALRIALALVFPLLPVPARAAAAVGAAGTDGLDGLIARRFAVTSTAGAVLDGISDKLFVGIAVITLTVEGALAPWMAVLVLLRDAAVSGSALAVAASRRWTAFRDMPPNAFGKATTALQFLLILAALLWPPAVPWLLPPTAATSGLAAATYIRRDVR